MQTIHCGCCERDHDSTTAGRPSTTTRAAGPAAGWTMDLCRSCLFGLHVVYDPKVPLGVSV